MVAFRNGYVPATFLRTVATGTRLFNSTASAYLNLRLIARLDDGIEVKPAGKYGAGYRDMATQLVFWKAGHGDRASLIKAGLDPNLQVSIAAPGASTHGLGTRIDILWNGHSPTQENVSLAARYGFTREFGPDDANHFRHDGKTAISGVRGFDKIRLVARFLNDRHIGTTTSAEHTGRRDSAFIALVQRYGQIEHWYSGPVDGITGPNTERAFDRIWAYLKER